MDSPSENKLVRRKKTTPSLHDAPPPNDDQSEPGPSSSNQEHFIPLAAKDSEWVGLSFYNPYFQSAQDYEVLEETELQNVGTNNSHENMPIYLMFPRLKEAKILPAESTTNVTRFLVGQKADFSHIKSTKKISLENKLQVVPELQEERDYWEEAGRSFIPGDSRGNSNQFISGKRRTQVGF